MTRLQKFVLGALFVVAIAAPLSAATTPPSGYWAFPAQTPNTDVVCATCPCNGPGNCSNGMNTVGYPATLGRYVGRFLDSQHTDDFQQTFRTIRAKNVYPAGDRIYMIMGSAAFAYSTDRFFSRLDSHETLMSAALLGQRSAWPAGATWEVFLKHDQMFYAERSVWDTTSGADGQERLYWIDFDDKGRIYLANSYYGWGILHDDNLTDGSGITSLFQYAAKDQIGDDVTLPEMIAVLKSAANPSTYYLAVSDNSTVTNIFDVTTPAAPVRFTSLRKPLIHFAKTSDLTRIGVITVDGRFEVYVSDSYVTGGKALYSETAPSGSLFEGVGSDGTNFYVAIDTPNGLVIRSYAPDPNGYHRVAELATNRSTPTTNIRYNDGYITHVGYENGTPELRVFKASVNSISEVDLHIAADPSGASSYFSNYYARTALAGYTAPGKFGEFFDSAVVKRNGHTYLIVTAYGLGDVYELNASDTLNIRNSGSVGTANPNSVSAAGSGPFYGDPIGFTATTSSGNAASVQFDFGNPEAVAADPNTKTAQTGTQVTHRYSGITSAASLPLTRTIKATNVADANVTGGASITLALPNVSAAIKGYKALPLAANTAVTLPIVVGDNFIDTSDGSVESHFTTWTLGGAATNALPSEAVSVGTCSASRTLAVTAHYGPYSGTSPNEVSQSDLPVGVAGMTYSVRPYVASIDVASSGANVVFSSTSRLTADPTFASTLAALQYKWELLDANNQPLASPAAVTGVGTVPNFVVPKTTFSSRGIRAHLVLTSPTALAGSCAGLETSEAFTSKLNGPDPTVAGGCTNGAPPCSFTANSLTSGLNPAAEGWTYAWAVDNNAVAGATNQTFTPTFAAAGSHTVTVTVTNPIGSASASATVTVTSLSKCQPIVPNQDFWVYYQGAQLSACAPGGTCSSGESISFQAKMALGYPISCSTHTFTWDFGDGTTGSGQNASHTYSSANTYNIKLTVTNDAGPAVMTSQVVVNASVAPPPVTPPPVTPPPVTPPPVNPPPVTPPPVGGCNTLDFTSFYVYFVNQAQTCSIYTTNACGVGDTINFDATPSFYNVNCGQHGYAWTFGDGTSGSGKSPTHVYTAKGSYTATVTVTNPKGSQSYTATVNVGAGTVTPPPVTPGPPPVNTCPAITAGQNVWISYQGASSNCAAGGLVSCETSEAISFQATSLSYDFSCSPHTFSWDFKDGTDPGSGRNVTHIFATPGTYNVTCNITVNGTTTPVTQSVIVGGGPIGGGPGPDPNAPFPFDFTIEPQTKIVAHTYVFTAFPTGSTTTTAYQWDFGDGSSGNGQIVLHTYADSNDHTITLRVAGTNGSVQHTLSPPRRHPSGH